MADPKLKRSSATIRYRATDGYRSEVTFSQIGRRGIDCPPEAPLLEAIDELARLLALFGFEKQAREKVDEACKRVAEWREKDGRCHG